MGTTPYRFATGKEREILAAIGYLPTAMMKILLLLLTLTSTSRLGRQKLNIYYAMA
jgi:hypothetical protein